MRIWHRRALSALIGLLLAVAWIVGASPPASAGGPTSVIIVQPDTGRAAALHTTDSRYQRLVDAVRAYYPPAGEATRPATVAACDQCEIRLTWLIHDVGVWRIDRVHLTAEDGIWLESVADESGAGSLVDRPTVWQRPHDQAALIDLLDAVGVTGPGTVDRAITGSEAMTPYSGVIGLAAGAAGLVVGLAIGRYTRRRFPRHPSDPQRVSLSG